MTEAKGEATGIPSIAYNTDQNNKTELIVLHPFSGDIRKTWPIENWINLALRLRKRNPLCWIGSIRDLEEFTKTQQIPKEELKNSEKIQSINDSLKIMLKMKFFIGHDMVGYNYRMPNVNAALLVAQLENLDNFISSKRKLANMYEAFFNSTDYVFVKEPMDSKSNYWLNSILLKNKQQRDEFLDETNSSGIMTRPIWTLMNKLPMFEFAQCGNLTNSDWLEEHVVNIPSSVIL